MPPPHPPATASEGECQTATQQVGHSLWSEDGGCQTATQHIGNCWQTHQSPESQYSWDIQVNCLFQNSYLRRHYLFLTIVVGTFSGRRVDDSILTGSGTNRTNFQGRNCFPVWTHRYIRLFHNLQVVCFHLVLLWSFCNIHTDSKYQSRLWLWGW